MRPGPSSIPPGSAPGGWFVHVYDRRGMLVLARALPAGTRHREPSIADDDAQRVADMLGPGADCCMVIYDGDSGDRLTRDVINAFAAREYRGCLVCGRSVPVLDDYPPGAAVVCGDCAMRYG